MIGLLLCFTVTPDDLQALPNVARVAVRPADSPTHRVIHILDWHYLHERRFRIDTPVGDYEAFLDQVEALQQQQRALIKAIGARAVFLEGLDGREQAALPEADRDAEEVQVGMDDTQIDQRKAGIVHGTEDQRAPARRGTAEGF